MPEPIPFWTDWRVWSVAAAFFGFTFGTLIKFGFDLWLDRIRRNREKTVFAIAFRAELGTLINDATVRLLAIEQNRGMTSGIQSIANLDIPTKVVYANNTHRLGELGARVAGLLVKAHGHADLLRHAVASVLAVPSETTLTPDYWDVIRSAFLRLTRNAEKAHNALDVFLGDPERYPILTDVPTEADDAEPPEPDPAPAP